MARMPGAVWRPLAEAQTHLQPRKTQVVTHTMVGYLKGTDALFRRSNIVTESTFGVGGPWDGADLDGSIWQWMDSLARADANFAANGPGISIETSDGGDPGHPWSAKQIDSLLAIYEWCIKEHGIPRRICRNPNDPGFGYHSLFDEWNHSAHACPGDTRIAQWHDIVIPRLLNPTPLPQEEDMQLSDVIPGTDVTVGIVLSRLNDAEHTINQMRTSQLAQSELLVKLVKKLEA
jgi:hypothetical protein